MLLWEKYSGTTVEKSGGEWSVWVWFRQEGHEGLSEDVIFKDLGGFQWQLPINISSLYSAKFPSLLMPASMNPEEEYICQEGLLMVHWAQIHNQSLAAIANRSLSHPLPQTEISTSCTMLLPAQSTIIRKFLFSSFNQWSETCPVQSELYNYILICI